MTSTTPRQITSSTDKPALGQSSDYGVPSSVIIISVLLVVLVIVAVVFLVLWLKRRSAGMRTVT
jgi:flagellar basal body-associated protein FliL